MKNFSLKSALMKKYRKAITEKLLAILEHNFNNVVQGSMTIGGYFEMIQANMMQPVVVVKNWSVPRYFKLFFQLLN